MVSRWDERLDEIAKYISEGMSMEEIGSKYGVSKQRMYQVFEKYGLNTLVKVKKNYLRDKGKKTYWLNKILTTKKIPQSERYLLLVSVDTPDYCPCLGIKLNYDGSGKEGWTRGDDSPSVDRIDSRIGYVEGNVHVISWRANRIKNDSTLEELVSITDYLRKLTY